MNNLDLPREARIPLDIQALDGDALSKVSAIFVATFPQVS
jgi:hypothetical protein